MKTYNIVNELARKKRRNSNRYLLRWISASLFCILLFYDVGSVASLVWNSKDQVTDVLQDLGSDAFNTLRNWVHTDFSWGTIKKSILQISWRLIVVWILFYYSASILTFLMRTLLKYIHISCGLITILIQWLVLRYMFNWKTCIRFVLSGVICLSYIYFVFFPPYDPIMFFTSRRPCYLYIFSAVLVCMLTFYCVWILEYNSFVC